MKYKWFAEQGITKVGLKRKTALENWKLKQLLKFPDKNIKLLEIGPGLGIFAEICVKNGINYTCIEPNAKLCEILKQKGIRVIQNEVPPIPYPDNEFNAVYIDQLLEHMPNYKEAVKLIEESKRILKPGGVLCVIIPNYLIEKGFFFDIDYTHNFVTSKRRVEQMLYDNDFKILMSKRFIGMINGWLVTLFQFIYAPFKFDITRWLCEIFHLNGILHKIRKNIFELLIIIAVK